MTKNNILCKKITIIYFVIVLIVSAYHCYADAPYEKFLVDTTNIHPQAIKNIKGILSISFTDPDYYNTERSNNPAQIQLFDSPDFANENSLLTIENQSAISVLEWSHGYTYKFPLLEKEGNFIKIIYNVKKNLTAWIYMEFIPKKGRDKINKDLNYLIAKNQKCCANLIIFSKFANEMEQVDIFHFYRKNLRKVYKYRSLKSFYKKDAKSIVEILKPDYKKKRMHFIGFYISEIKDGFAKLHARFFEVYGDPEEYPLLGWIPLFDKKGNLTIWTISRG